MDGSPDLELQQPLLLIPSFCCDLPPLGKSGVVGECPEQSAGENQEGSPHVVGAGGEGQAGRPFQERVALDEEGICCEEGLLGVNALL